jgi:hypothetical protein
MPTFTTSFTSPAAITGALLATPDPDTSSVLLEWTATSLGVAFWRYRVYRIDALGQYHLIGSPATEATVSFVDYEAPHGPSSYAVTVDNGWQESDPITASAVLDLGFWIIDPSNPSNSFAIPHVATDESEFDSQEERFAPLGRSAYLVVGGALLAPAGSISARVLRSETELIPRLLQAAQTFPYVILKNPFGDVSRARVGKVRRSRAGSATQMVSFDWTTVEA